MAINFASATSAVYQVTNAVLDNPTALSTSIWVNPNDKGGGGNGRIWDKRTVADTQCRLFYWSGSTGILYPAFEVDTNLVNLIQLSDVAVSTQSWSNIIQTWDGTLNLTGVHIYINGAEVSYSASSSNGTGVAITDAGGIFNIGNKNLAAFNRACGGVLSELAIWTSVLSTSEILALAKGKIKGLPLQIQPSNLKAYFPLNDFSENIGATGTGTVRDLSATGATGTPGFGAGGSSPLGVAEQILSYQP